MAQQPQPAQLLRSPIRPRYKAWPTSRKTSMRTDGHGIAIAPKPRETASTAQARRICTVSCLRLLRVV